MADNNENILSFYNTFICISTTTQRFRRWNNVFRFKWVSHISSQILQCTVLQQYVE